MPRLDADHWQRRLAELAETHHVPGAALGLLHGEEIVDVAYGVLNLATGVETTTDSAFQIGSITKVWTTTLLMQLVDEGKIDLDGPIVDVLPELHLSDPDVNKRVSLRHLLTHTSGIDGDVFDDTGRGDDCLEKYVALLGNSAQIHPLGATFSYCNSGFNIAGRIIEVLTGKTWDAAIRERIFAPLGLTHTSTLPEEALLGRAAMGHVAKTGELPHPAPVWGLPRCVGPAGLISSTPRDLLTFARMHLNGGGELISTESAARMTEEQVVLPDKHTLGDSWGLGWIRFGWDGHRLFGHDGSTLGQNAYLRILPDQDFAVTLLTNGGNTGDLYHDLFTEIFRDVVDLAMPAPLEPPAEPSTVDFSQHLGTYERASVRLDVLDGPVLRTTSTGPLAELDEEPVVEYPMVAISENLYVVRPPDQQTWTPVTFYRLPDGSPYVHFGVRATPKVS